MTLFGPPASNGDATVRERATLQRTSDVRCGAAIRGCRRFQGGAGSYVKVAYFLATLNIHLEPGEDAANSAPTTS